MYQQESLDAPQWYVVRTNPHSEHLAASALEREGFKIFLPCIKTACLRAGHRDMPLFPGYVFLRLALAEGWPPLHQIPHVLGWVRFQGTIPPVPDEVIAELAQRVEMINSEGGLWIRFHPGERVRIVSHIMEGVAEVLEAAKSPQAKVRVIIAFMGRLVPTQVAWQDLRPIEDQPQVPKEAHQGYRRTRGKGRWIRNLGPRTAMSM